MESTFDFKTKAQNLRQLRPLVRESAILEMVIFTVRDWRTNSDHCLKRIFERFTDERLVVRSSSTNEDTFESSLAGQFESVLNVQLNPEALSQAIEIVIDSYASFASEILDFELLVQPMIRNVRCSGVIFTRTLETFSPYYVINYDDTTQLTDTVTSGSTSALQQVLIYKEAEPKSNDWRGLVNAAYELERLCQCDYLDIEFAIDQQGQVFVLQVRPLVKTVIQHHAWMDHKTKIHIEEIRVFIEYKLRRKPGVHGRRTIFGQMPDWNPAEIIGTRPKPLAYSLYRYLIMDSAWRVGRQLIGYQTPESHALMVQIAGSPYVDVRASFHSLLPQGLSPQLSEKLVDLYLNRLEANPQYHDKIGFNIVHSCLDFSFPEVQRDLMEDGFTSPEVIELKQALLRLTNAVVVDEKGKLDDLINRVEELTKNRAPWEVNVRYPLELLSAIDILLKDCIQYGTIPFAAVARCAFIGTKLMRSLAEIGELKENELQGFLQSVETVAGQYTADVRAYSVNTLSVEEMCERYGHLRPGTYDITTPRYDERPDIYFVPMLLEERESQTKKEFHFSRQLLKRVDELLEEIGFEFSATELLDFVARSIELREKVKFEFTKNISLALKYIGQFGAYYGFSTEEMAFVTIEQIQKWNQESMPQTFVEQLRHEIDEQKFVYANQKQILLRDLIFSPDDLEYIQMMQASPNFTTRHKIVAEKVNLAEVALDSVELELEGRIVCIEQADPGYDWIFSRKIGGLVTKYGGVASHMAVRCAEFGIPAAIGCGEALYQKLLQSKFIDLNCQERKVSPCEGFQ